MKKVFLPFMFALLLIGVNAQETGMHFEHNKVWNKILAKAKAENKYVFLDCYTTWCGPCKTMSTTIFPKADVGKFYNAKFINAKVQLDKTDKDNADVKSWYADAQMIETKYDVKAYPTYLIFSPNGEVVQRFVGSMTAEDFLAKGKDALVPEKQYYTQLRKYQAGDKTPSFLYKLATMSKNVYDMKNAKLIVDDYLATQNDLYTKENLSLLKEFIQNSKDRGFDMILKNPEKVDAVLGESSADNIIKSVAMNEDVFPLLYQSGVANPDWDVLEKKLITKYPKQATEITDYSKAIYYYRKKEWNNFGPAVNNYMKSFSSKALPAEINQFAWAIFENCNDITCVENALAWSKQSFAKDNNHQFMDTYANLLMKAGKKQEAIEWETKAVAIAKEKKDPQVGEYEGTLSEMKLKK